MANDNKDVVLVVSLVLSVVSLVLLFGVTWYFQSSLDLLQQQVEYDRELLFKLQEQINVSIKPVLYYWLYSDNKYRNRSNFHATNISRIPKFREDSRFYFHEPVIVSLYCS